MPHGSKTTLPVAMEDPTMVVYLQDWNKISSYIEVHPESFDTRDLFKNLPDGQCHCPHWGYIIKGQMRVLYADREEVIGPGEIYYMPPGHNLIVEAGTELVEFSPSDELNATVNAIMGS